MVGPGRRRREELLLTQVVRAARDLAHSLGSLYLSLDLREEFRRGVVEPGPAGHVAGLDAEPARA